MLLDKRQVERELNALEWPKEGLSTTELIQRLARGDTTIDLAELEAALGDGNVFYGPAQALGAVPGDRWQLS